MIVGNTIRLVGGGLLNGYFVKNTNGFQLSSPSIENGVNLYCSVFNGKITAFVEVYECICTGHEKILFKSGNYKAILKHYLIEEFK